MPMEISTRLGVAQAIENSDRAWKAVAAVRITQGSTMRQRVCREGGPIGATKTYGDAAP
jgi:hypothetical protein